MVVIIAGLLVFCKAMLFCC